MHQLHFSKRHQEASFTNNLNSIQKRFMVFPLFLRVRVLPLHASTKGGTVFHVHSNLPIRVVHSQWHAVALKQVCQVLVSDSGGP